MRGKGTANNAKELEASTTEGGWLNWCRLCAKADEDGENRKIFRRSDQSAVDSTLATAVGKYFWVNIKVEDKIPTRLCTECHTLVNALIAFTERVNKVQTMYCLLQNLKPTSNAHANKIRKQCGLIDDTWVHIIKQQQVSNDEGVREKEAELFQDDLKSSVEDQEEFLADHCQETGDQEVYYEEHALPESAEEPDHEDDHTIEYDLEEEMDDYELTDEDGDKAKRIKLSTTQKEKYGGNKADGGEDGEDDKSVDEVSDSDLFKELKFKVDEEDDELVIQARLGESRDGDGEDEGEDDGDGDGDGDADGEGDGEMESGEKDSQGDCDEKVKKAKDVKNSKGSLNDIMSTLGRRKRGRPPKRIREDGSDSLSEVYRYECRECKKKYKNPNVYRKHMSAVHNVTLDQLPDFVCKVCKKECHTESRLKMHLRSHLPLEEKMTVPCPYCDRKFTQVGVMRQHVNGVHHQMKPFICDQCGRALKTLAALNEHKLVHTNECPFECEVCHKRFKNKPRLKVHLDTHTDMTYVCSDCGLQLNTRRTLLSHKLVHSDEKRYKCEFCDAAFKRSKALKNHLILHSGLRPYKCNFCDKTFSNGSNCRSHKRKTHPLELAEEEAKGLKSAPASVPRLEELRSATNVVEQPRRVKRHAGGLPDHLRALLIAAEKRVKNSSEDGDDEDDAETECFDDRDIQKYEIVGDLEEDTEGEGVVVEDGGVEGDEEEEETVIYEIIDEI